MDEGSSRTYAAGAKPQRPERSLPLQSPSLPHLLDDLSDAERSALLDNQDLRSLADVFATIPDPRQRRGQRYDLPFLLTCLVAALLCTCTSLDAVGQWCVEHRSLVRRLFGPRQHLTPSGSLDRWLLPKLAPASLEWAVASWIRQTRQQQEPEPVALDGKTVRGAGSAGQPAPHLLSVSTHASQETLAQVQVDAKTKESPVGQALLPWLPLPERVVTADALQTHALLAQGILEQGGDSLLSVKENQGHLYSALVESVTDPVSRYQEAQTVDRQHGRIERRRRVTAALNEYLAWFPGVSQAMEIQRQVQDRQGTQEETAYFVTSCASSQADPDRLLALIRGHWQIEAKHWIRDVDCGEDRSCVRTGHAPQILAALRHAVLTLIRRTGTTQIAAARRHYATHPAQAFRLIQQRSALC